MKMDNITTVMVKFAAQLNSPLIAQKVYDELLIHPDYPSLLSISDILTALNIENAAFRIDADELINVPCPFIAHTTLNDGDFILIHKISESTVIVSNEKWNKHKLSSEEFNKIFAGIVLTANVLTPKSINFSGIFIRSKWPLINLSLVAIFIYAIVFHTSYLQNISWQLVSLTIFKTAGLITSILLLIQSIDSNNPLIQKLCKGGSKTDCKNILSSKAAKVFEGLTWSEVGFFYFAGTWLLLLFGGGSIAIKQSLAVLNIVSLPYTFYSIYYQAKVAKQWCVLCCTVQALLWLEFIPLYTVLHSPFMMPDNPEWSSIIISFLLPVILWVLLKPLLLQAQQIDPLKQQLQKFKYNADLFGKLLIDQPKYAQPDEEWSVVLGNAEADNIITMVTNPYCPPCAKTHKLLHELLEQRNDLQARIVFTADNTDNDLKTPVSRHIMSLHALSDKDIVKQAMYDWYEQKQKDYDAWAKVYPVKLNEAEYNKINKQKAWCEMAEIKGTPTMLLNGYVIPDMYRLNDLKYMIG